MAQQDSGNDTRTMETHSLAGSAGGSSSRLLIHASRNDPHQGWRAGTVLQRIRALVRDRSRPSPTAASLEIHDVQGHRLLWLTHTGALVDVVLPAGTYHVTLQVGNSSHRYTVALEQAAATHLYPHLGPTQVSNAMPPPGR